MNFNEYQKLAERTMPDVDCESAKLHALHGMVSEVGEIHGIFQKMYQGHELKHDHIKKELGDLLWFIAEYCTAVGWNMSEVAQLNIDKLKARFPEGFSAERSLNRNSEDI